MTAKLRYAGQVARLRINCQDWNLPLSRKEIWKSWANTHSQCDLCLLEECVPFFSLVLLPCTWHNLAHLPVSFCLSLQDDPRWGWEEAVSVSAPVFLHSGIFLTASADAVWNFPGSCDFSWLMWLSNWEEGDEDDRLLKAFKKMLLERIIAHWSHIQPLIRLSKQQYLKALVIFFWLVTTPSWAPTDKEPGAADRANIRQWLQGSQRVI